MTYRPTKPYEPNTVAVMPLLEWRPPDPAGKFEGTGLIVKEGAAVLLWRTNKRLKARDCIV
jgi:hypothetical protein